MQCKVDKNDYFNIIFEENTNVHTYDKINVHFALKLTVFICSIVTFVFSLLFYLNVKWRSLFIR